MKHKYQFYFTILVACIPVVLFKGAVDEVCQGTMTPAFLIFAFIFSIPFLIYLRFGKKIKHLLKGQSDPHWRKRIIIGVMLIIILFTGQFVLMMIANLFLKGLPRSPIVYFIQIIFMLTYLYSLIVIFMFILKAKKMEDQSKNTTIDILT